MREHAPAAKIAAADLWPCFISRAAYAVPPVGAEAAGLHLNFFRINGEVLAAIIAIAAFAVGHDLNGGEHETGSLNRFSKTGGSTEIVLPLPDPSH
jgi:hypothetical protein